MTKTAIAFAFLMVAGISASYADPKTDSQIIDAVQQDRTALNDHRKVTNNNTGEIESLKSELKSLKEKLAANQAASAPQAAASTVDQRTASRIATAEQQCAVFRTYSERDRKTLSDRWAKMSNQEFADAMKNCNGGLAERQRGYYDKQMQVALQESPTPAPASGGEVVDEGEALAAEPVNYRTRQMAPGHLRELRHLLAERDLFVLGPPPAGLYRGYRGERPGHMPIPRGCREIRRHDPVTRQTFVRVTCR